MSTSMLVTKLIFTFFFGLTTFRAVFLEMVMSKVVMMALVKIVMKNSFLWLTLPCSYAQQDAGDGLEYDFNVK